MSSDNFYSLNILKRTDGTGSSKAGTTEGRPAASSEEDFNAEAWGKLVGKGAELVYNMRRTASNLAKQPGMNGKSESAFQVSRHPFYV